MRTVCIHALFIRTLRWKHAVHSLPACDVFHNTDSNCIFFFMGGLCVVYHVHVWLGQTSVNTNTRYLERVPYLCLTLDWRWSDFLLASTFTCRKTLTFLSIQKMCAEVDAHKKWMTFIRRSCQTSTNSDARPANHNALTKILHFFVRWTCVLVCVTGPKAFDAYSAH